MSKSTNTFEQAATTGVRENLAGELYHFLASGKRWWLMPFVVALLFMGLLMLLASTAAAPFIYTIF